MIYFVSDTHFNHKNIIKYCKRPFDSVEEMDKLLIENWNKTVTPDDTIYILGDFMFYSERDPEEFLNILNGKKHLILGNHDSYWLKPEHAGYFESISEMKTITIDNKTITLCHYPLLSFCSDYQMFGHIHNNLKDPAWSYLKNMDCSLCACVEINNYCPVSFEQLIVNNDLFKKGISCYEE